MSDDKQQINQETLELIEAIGATYAGEVRPQVAQQLLDRSIEAKPAMDAAGLGQINDTLIQDISLELGLDLPEGMSSAPASPLVQRDGLVFMPTQEGMQVFSIADGVADIDPSEPVSPSSAGTNPAERSGHTR